MKKFIVILLSIIVLVLGVSMVAAQELPGSGWESGQQIQNVGTTGTDITLTVYNQDGVSAECGSKAADPGESVNFLTDECAVPVGFQGSGVVSAGSPIAAIVNVNNRTVGAAAGQYRGTDGDDVATQIAFPLVKNQFAGRTTIYYVQNASGGTIDIDATFTTGTLGGATTDYPVSFQDVPANAMVIIAPADASVPANQVGSLVVEGTGALAGSALEYEDGVAVAANLQASKAFTPSDYDSSAYCPLVRNAHTPRDQTTGIQAQNVSGAAQSITVDYTYSIGGGAVQTDSVTSPELADGESFTFFGKDATYGLPAGALGSAIVSGDGDGAIAVVVNDRGFALNPSPVTTYACFPASSATTEITVPLYKEYFFGNTSGIQVQNVSGSDVTVTLEYNPVGGTAAEVSHTEPIPAGGSKTFFGVSQGTAPSDIDGAEPSLVNTYGGVVITSDSGNIVAIANESSFGGFGTTASGQDTKNYEGFNK